MKKWLATHAVELCADAIIVAIYGGICYGVYRKMTKSLADICNIDEENEEA